MDFSNINLIAIGCAVVAGMVTGMVWYGVLARQWMSAAGLTESDIEQKPSLYIVAVIAQVIIAYFLAGLIWHIDAFSVTGGMITAFLVWLPFTFATMAVDHRFQGKGWDLSIIDGGYWLAVLLLQGAIIGWFGL